MISPHTARKRDFATTITGVTIPHAKSISQSEADIKSQPHKLDQFLSISTHTILYMSSDHQILLIHKNHAQAALGLYKQKKQYDFQLL